MTADENTADIKTPRLDAIGRSARRRFLTGAVAAALSILGAGSSADAQRLPPGQRRRRIIQRFMSRDPEFRDRAMRARRSGELRPLRELNARLRKGGYELLDADLIETSAGWVYDIRVLGPGGRVRDVLIDGRALRRVSDRPRP